MEINIDRFEEVEDLDIDSYSYSWYEFKEDNDVPENVVNELKNHVMDIVNRQIKHGNKIYQMKNKSRPSGLSDEKEKEYILSTFSVESTESRYQFIKNLLIESKPIIDIIRKLADTHELVNWENLPLTSNYESSFTFKKINDIQIDFKITKLWIDFKKDHFEVKMLTFPPGYRDIIQNHTIGKLYISQNGKKLISYCGHCDNMKFG